MDKVAILVDGAFYLFRAKHLWGAKTAEARANELYAYCMKHLWVNNYDLCDADARKDEPKKKRDVLYRIFFYDCPPSTKKVYNPLTKQQEDLAKSEQFSFRKELHEQLRFKRKVALRYGELLDSSMDYTISPKVFRQLINNVKTIDTLMPEDLSLVIQQKGVDMRIGIDIASLAYKKQVTKIILVSGDSDFVPAAKLARREGIDFVLDPMGIQILPKLNEHIDGRQSFIRHDPETSAKIRARARCRSKKQRCDRR